MKLRNQQQSERILARAAFTLMEVLVVVAIIVALAGVGGFFLIRSLGDSQERTAALQAMELTKAVDAYAIDHNGQYPPSLDILLQQTQFGGPYLRRSSALFDPWGQRFQYDPSGQRNMQAGNYQPDIFTVAPGRQELIGNW